MALPETNVEPYNSRSLYNIGNEFYNSKFPTLATNKETLENERHGLKELPVNAPSVSMFIKQLSNDNKAYNIFENENREAIAIHEDYKLATKRAASAIQETVLLLKECNHSIFDEENILKKVVDINSGELNFLKEIPKILRIISEGLETLIVTGVEIIKSAVTGTIKFVSNIMSRIGEELTKFARASKEVLEKLGASALKRLGFSDKEIESVAESVQFGKDAEKIVDIKDVLKSSSGIDKGLAEDALKFSEKNGFKYGLKTILEDIPFVGTALGLGFAGLREFVWNDPTGAKLEVAASVSSLIPFGGTVVAIAINILLVARDFYQSRYGVYPEQDPMFDKRMKPIVSVIFNYFEEKFPIIQGKFTVDTLIQLYKKTFNIGNNKPEVNSVNPSIPKSLQNNKVILGKNGTFQDVMNYFLARGYTKEAAAGITGNLIQESSLNVNADNGTHYGLAQWDYSRQQDFRKYKGFDIRVSTLNDQLDFIDHELNENYQDTKNLIQAASTAAEASLQFQNYYEVAPGQDTDRRETYASTVYNKMFGTLPEGQENISGVTLNSKSTSDELATTKQPTINMNSPDVNPLENDPRMVQALQDLNYVDPTVKERLLKLLEETHNVS